MTRPTDRRKRGFHVLEPGTYYGGVDGQAEGQPPPITPPPDPADQPDHASSEHFATAFRLSEAFVSFEQAATTKEQLAATITLDSGDGWATPAAGSLLVAWWSVRSGTAHSPTTPTGWTPHPSGTVDYDGYRSGMYYRVADGTESSITFSLTAGDRHALTVAEFPGNLTLVDDAENGAGTFGTALTAGAVTPTAGGNALVVGGVSSKTSDVPSSVTPGAGWTELADTNVDVSTSPLHWMAYQIVATASGSYNPSGTASNSGTIGGQALAFDGLDREWNVLAPQANDGDDGTCVRIAGPDVLRIDLGSPFAIARMRLLIGCENAGAKSYVLSAANEADFSDEVTVHAFAFTATGSYTDDEVLETWVAPDAYRFWQLSGDNESRDICSLELYEVDPLTSALEHIDDPSDAHDASAISYDGGSSGLSADNVQDAIDELDGRLDTGPASDTLVWMPLTTVVGGDPVLVWDGDDSLIPTLIPL